MIAMKKKLIILSASAITIALISIAVVYGWFYYASRDTTLSSDDALDITTNLYSIDVNTPTVTKASADATTSSYSLSCDYSFFQWGDEYIIEDDSPRYYALECIYNDDTYISGRFRSILEFSLKCYAGSVDGTNTGLTYTYNDESVPLRFDIAKVSYAFADNTLDLTKASDVVSAVSSASFTSLSFSGDDSDYTADYYELSSSVNTLFTDDSAPTFAYDSNSKIRLIYLIKVEPNTENVNTYMNGDASEEIFDALGSELYIYLSNVLTITDTFRSVPLKSGTISSSTAASSSGE